MVPLNGARDSLGLSRSVLLTYCSRKLASADISPRKRLQLSVFPQQLLFIALQVSAG